ncbi:unnamed protein product, partial [Discosporangium mesarthrocarpum]
MELFSFMMRGGQTPQKNTINLLVDLLDSVEEYDKAVYVYETSLAGVSARESWDPSYGNMVDLHGYSGAVAKAAIRSGLKKLLQRYINAGKDPSVVCDFTLITGVGKHSKRPFEPVLRPAAANMFLTEFNPPLPTRLDSDNKGRLLVR